MGPLGAVPARAAQLRKESHGVAHAVQGRDPGGSECLWALPDASRPTADGDTAPSSRLDAELGYGIGLLGGGFTGTPHAGFGLSVMGRGVRVGWRLGPADGGDFEVNNAARRDNAGDTPGHRFGGLARASGHGRPHPERGRSSERRMGTTKTRLLTNPL